MRDNSSAAPLNERADEELVKLVQTQDSSEAKEVLITRRLQWSQNWVAWKARRDGLTKEDSNDLRQQVAIWLRDAIAQYDLRQLKLDKPCRFPSFAGQVVRRRYRNSVRGLKRVRDHVHAGIDPLTLSVAEEQESRHIYPTYLQHDPVEEDPARLLEVNEEFLKLQHLLADLSPEDRELCAAAVQRSLPELAQHRHVSYRTINRRCHVVLNQLRRRLEGA
jgi:DNA-directed RNA polymerase specialized sigma24 family protein